ncbi:MAG: CapA family protein [Clostridia bacterium]|nr:CapA family protein [Clostridia bacterium]
MKKVIISILTILLLVAFVFFGMYLSEKYIMNNTDLTIKEVVDNAFTKEDKKDVKENDEPIIVELEEKEDIKVSMSVIGDIMCHNSQYNDAYKNGEYDFSYVFDDIKEHIETADLAIGNLETTFAGKDRGYASYPTFNTPEILAQDLKELGIDVVSTANNHSLDTGYKGIESTIDYLDEAGILHTGTYKSVEDQENIVIKEVNGLKFAFLAYTYGTNGIPVPSGREYCINLIDKELIKTHLDLAKNLKPDVICVNMHWGIEYQNSPNAEQEELANFLFENGVDIILGSHPHVLQKMESKEILLSNGELKNGFVIYSLGNFMSGQTKANTRNSIILKLDIIKEGSTGNLRFENIDYIPIYTYTYPNFKNYKVLDIRKAIQNYEDGINTLISRNTYDLLNKELEHVNYTVGY